MDRGKNSRYAIMCCDFDARAYAYQGLEDAPVIRYKESA